MVTAQGQENGMHARHSGNSHEHGQGSQPPASCDYQSYTPVAKSQHFPTSCSQAPTFIPPNNYYYDGSASPPSNSAAFASCYASPPPPLPTVTSGSISNLPQSHPPCNLVYDHNLAPNPGKQNKKASSMLRLNTVVFRPLSWGFNVSQSDSHHEHDNGIYGIATGTNTRASSMVIIFSTTAALSVSLASTSASSASTISISSSQWIAVLLVHCRVSPRHSASGFHAY